MVFQRKILEADDTSQRRDASNNSHTQGGTKKDHENMLDVHNVIFSIVKD
jgi:hypothetical protein